MKTSKTILLLLAILLCRMTNAQSDKVITVVLKDFSEACGQDPGDAVFCLTDEKGQPIKERYTCNMEAGVWKVEPKDLITENWMLNPKYKGKSAKLICKVGGGGWFVEKVEFLGSTTSLPTYPKATCKASNDEGKIYIVEDNVIYELDKNGEKKSKSWGIQNKDEVCVKGNDCVKAKMDANGCVKLYHLPNITEVTGSLKIVGDKIYRTLENGCDADTKKEHLTFSGNKTQAALIAIVYRLGMGH